MLDNRRNRRRYLVRVLRIMPPPQPALPMFEEMTQRHELFLRMLHTASAKRRVNVVSDHGPNGFPAMGLL